MDALVSEAVSELSRLGLTDLLKKDPLRCKLRFNSQLEVILVCPALLQICCPCLPLSSSKTWTEIINLPNLKKRKIKAYKNIFQFIHTGTLDMSLLVDPQDYVEFVKMSSAYIVMPTLKNLCLRVIELQTTPANIWQVLRQLDHATHLYSICNKVLTLQSIECLKHLNVLNFTLKSFNYFLTLDEMNIDSEIQLIQAYQKIKPSDFDWNRRFESANNIRFMTLSKAELESITPFLRGFLTAENVEALLSAVLSGDSSKMPSNFSKSCIKRKPTGSDIKSQLIKIETCEQGNNEVPSTISLVGSAPQLCSEESEVEIIKQIVGQKRKRKIVKNGSVGPVKRSCVPKATSEQVLQTDQQLTHLILPPDGVQLAETIKFETTIGEKKIFPFKKLQKEMDELAVEAQLELSRLGLLEHKYRVLCKLHLYNIGSVMVCQLVMQTCCPKHPVSNSKVWPLDVGMKMPNTNMNAFKNIIELTHKGAIDLRLLNTLDDYLDFVLLANEWIVVPELLRLSRRVLQLHVQPSNVWYLLSRLQHNPHLAAICDEVLSNRTRECLRSLLRANLDQRMLVHFLSLDQMHISLEAELLSGLLKFERRNGNCDVLTASLRCLRFMSFRKDDLPLFEDQLKRLLPGDSEAVILAIESGDSSKLPQMFETRGRILTASEDDLSALEISIEDSPLPDLKEINKLVSEAALQLAPRGIPMQSSDVCTLVVGKEKEKIKISPHLCKTGPKKTRMKAGQKKFIPNINPNCIKVFHTFVSTGRLDMSLLRNGNDFLDFAIENQKIHLPLMMKLSLDLLKLLIRPENVWPVLHKITPFFNLRSVCNQVLHLQTLECLQYMDEDGCRNSLWFLLKQEMASIDSEVQFVQAIQKLKFTDDEEWHQVLHQLFQAVRFMTLSKAELDSIMPFLQENLSHGDLVALQLAVVTGDSSKLPLGFSNSTQKRNNTSSYFAPPSSRTVAVSLNPAVLEKQTIAVKQERSPAPENFNDVQVECEPTDEEQPMNCIDSVVQPRRHCRPGSKKRTVGLTEEQAERLKRPCAKLGIRTMKQFTSRAVLRKLLRYLPGGTRATAHGSANSLIGAWMGNFSNPHTEAYFRIYQFLCNEGQPQPEFKEKN